MPKRVAEVRFENGQMGKLLMYDGLNRAIFLIKTMCYVLIVRFAPRQAKIVSNKTCSLLQEVDMSLEWEEHCCSVRDETKGVTSVPYLM